MTFLILSRAEIERMAAAPFPMGTALISISDVGCEPASLAHAPSFLLQLAFDDVDNEDSAERDSGSEKNTGISALQADRIAAFYLENQAAVSTFICQCEYGQSRSAAVAAALMEFRSKNGIAVFSHYKYYPNKVVFRSVLKALRACALARNEEKDG